MALSRITCTNVHQWDDQLGSITQTVRGSHVDITVRLGHAASRLWSILVVCAGLGVLFIAGRIVEAFLTGRAQQILDAAMKGGQ